MPRIWIYFGRLLVDKSLIFRYSENMKTVIIRDRGQLTIPDSIRRTIDWAMPLSAVTISIEKPDEIVIRPHGRKVAINWDDLWKQIKKARSFKGSGSGDLSTFVVEDRQIRR
ncbi:MAG: hypothetical protein COU68_01070 [Candidatus Pacebacteria bacterium CG10_big_fil_rev_8_21_14_0_10_45_6]|nr:MAG: hypothetical protein COU68_01070 [Candidatus Pacebacteria bacterium CG10_big_fil_rev_8_21_14_0_10_45_6]